MIVGKAIRWLGWHAWWLVRYAWATFLDGLMYLWQVTGPAVAWRIEETASFINRMVFSGIIACALIAFLAANAWLLIPTLVLVFAWLAQTVVQYRNDMLQDPFAELVEVLREPIPDPYDPYFRPNRPVDDEDSDSDQS